MLLDVLINVFNTIHSISWHFLFQIYLDMSVSETWKPLQLHYDFLEKTHLKDLLRQEPRNQKLVF